MTVVTPAGAAVRLRLGSGASARTVAMIAEDVGRWSHMRDRRRAARPRAVHLVCGAAALGLVLGGCSSSGEPGEGGSSGSTSPVAEEPGPPDVVKTYTLEEPTTKVEGDVEDANAALRSFAEDMASGDREGIEEVLYAPTPQDQSVVDKSLRIYEGANWDLDGVRWTKDGVHGPCYLLRGKVDGQPVHMAGWAAWNDTLQEWEFGTLGLPGSPDYPDVPSC